jgi:hypothetical protein
MAKLHRSINIGQGNPATLLLLLQCVHWRLGEILCAAHACGFDKCDKQHQAHASVIMLNSCATTQACGVLAAAYWCTKLSASFAVKKATI